MADYVYVRLTVLHARVDQVKALYPEDATDLDTGTETTTLDMGEQRYGDLDGLEALEAEGIAYDCDSDSSYDKEECTVSVRFTPEGGLIKKTLYSSDNSICISDLLLLLKDPLALKTKIIEAEENRTVLPWDNQEEYGKLYRANQLIGLTAPTPAS